jgi:hypothetical protein
MVTEVFLRLTDYPVFRRIIWIRKYDFPPIAGGRRGRTTQRYTTKPATTSNVGL